MGLRLCSCYYVYCVDVCCKIVNVIDVCSKESDLDGRCGCILDSLCVQLVVRLMFTTLVLYKLDLYVDWQNGVIAWTTKKQRPWPTKRLNLKHETKRYQSQGWLKIMDGFKILFSPLVWDSKTISLLAGRSAQVDKKRLWIFKSVVLCAPLVSMASLVTWREGQGPELPMEQVTFRWWNMC